MDCKWPKLTFCSEIPLFYSFESVVFQVQVSMKSKSPEVTIQSFIGIRGQQPWLHTFNCYSTPFIGTNLVTPSDLFW